MDDGEAASVALFSYGTLQLEHVQLAKFGRLLQGKADALPGYSLIDYEIPDPEVAALSGKAVHTMARPSQEPDAEIPGMLFMITAEELASADDYEVDDYVRIEVELASGAEAFVYVGI